MLVFCMKDSIMCGTRQLDCNMVKLSFALPEYEAAINILHDEVQLTLHMRDEILSSSLPCMLSIQALLDW